MKSDQDQAVVLLLAHRAMLIGYITAIVRDSHMAEDVFQEVALTVLRKWPLVKGQPYFPGWVRKVARLEALAALRRRRRNPELLDGALLDLLEGPWAAEDHATARDGALRECLNGLSPHARELIRLRFVENLCGQQMADLLSRPLNTIYVGLSRTYRLLAECVKRRLAREGAAHE